MLKTKFKKLGVNLLLFFLTCLLLFAGLEIALRLFVPQNLVNNEQIYIADPVIDKRLIPNSTFQFQNAEYRYTVRTNSEGFRDDNHAKEKPENVKRILILGDSFTYGPGVEQNDIYPALLEKHLNEKIDDIKYEILAMACGGYGPEHYLAVLKNIGLAYKPDMVILGMYVDNDVTDKLDLSGELLPEERSLLFNLLYPINNFLEERSHAFIFIRARLDYPLWVLGLRPYYFPNVFWKDVPTDLMVEWQRTFRTITSIKDVCDQSDISLLAVLIPAIYQVEQDFWNDYLNIYDIDPTKVDINLPQKKFSAFFKKREIKHLDLLPYFRESDVQTLYFPIDRHWNEAGHALSAKKIRDVIQRNPDLME